jgi:site-specific recombinase XerD
MENHMLYRYFKLDEQRQLIGAAAKSSALVDRRDHAWMRALLYSGLRITEFSLITLGDAMASLRERYLFIPKMHRKGKRRDHKVFMTHPLRDAIEDLIKIHFEIVQDKKTNVDSALVISRQHGDAPDGKCPPMSVRSYELRVKHWAAVASLPKEASPHWFRHTRAMNIMRGSAANDPRGVAQLALGHATISSTGVYTGVLREELEEALNQTDSQSPKRVTLAHLRKEFERRGS